MALGKNRPSAARTKGTLNLIYLFDLVILYTASIYLRIYNLVVPLILLVFLLILLWIGDSSGTGVDDVEGAADGYPPVDRPEQRGVGHAAGPARSRRRLLLPAARADARPVAAGAAQAARAVAAVRQTALANGSCHGTGPNRCHAS